MDGIINVLKPVGMSSYQVIEQVKKITGIKKIGHTGTLDPGAAGVLPLCLGMATKVAGIVAGFKKGYRAEITFGIVTDTQDSFGKVLRSQPVSITRDEIQEILKKFTGTIEQIPPMHSAVKSGGKKLYQLARKGIEVERKPRKVTVYRLELVDYFPPNKALIDIECSKGTYVRTLCHDMGTVAGYGAIMSYLVRFQSGCFSLKESITLDEIEEAANSGRLGEYILPVDFPLQHLEKILVKDSALKYAVNGNPLHPGNLVSPAERLEDGQKVRIYHGDRFIAIGKVKRAGERISIKIDRVFYKQRKGE